MMNPVLLIGILTAIGTAPLPAMAFAQSPGSAAVPTPALEQAPPDRPATPAPARPDPEQHLAAAKQLLDAVPAKSLDDGAQKQLSQLREDFGQLMTGNRTRSQALATSGGSSPAATQNPSKGVVDWKKQFDDVERDLTAILGGGALRTVSAIEPAVRTQLEQVRTSVELFYDAATSNGGIP